MIERDPRLSKIFLSDHIDRHLRPPLRHGDVVHREDDGAVGIFHLRSTRDKVDPLVGRAPFFRKMSLDLHPSPSLLMNARRKTPPSAAKRTSQATCYSTP